MDDPLLEVSVVAKRLKRAPETIRRYIRSGRLRATRPSAGRIGGHYLIAESAVAAFLSATKHYKSLPTH